MDTQINIKSKNQFEEFKEIFCICADADGKTNYSLDGDIFHIEHSGKEYFSVTVDGVVIASNIWPGDSLSIIMKSEKIKTAVTEFVNYLKNGDK